MSPVIVVWERTQRVYDPKWRACHCQASRFAFVYSKRAAAVSKSSPVHRAFVLVLGTNIAVLLDCFRSRLDSVAFLTCTYLRRRRDPRGQVIDDRSFCPSFEPPTRGTTLLLDDCEWTHTQPPTTGGLWSAGIHVTSPTHSGSPRAFRPAPQSPSWAARPLPAGAARLGRVRVRVRIGVRVGGLGFHRVS